ncbi:MAG: DUF1326 domain-containing protein [Terriglobia bacterium]
MRRFLAAAVVGLFFAAGLAVPAEAAIKGDYIEVRGADVYTGPCFANSEMNLEGKQAILAWKVTSGSWDGVPLDGLSVVAVVRANATLGDRFEDPYPAKAILIVDVNATARQRTALADFARSMAGRLTENVVRVEALAISLNVSEGGQHGSASLVAGNLASIKTRSLCAGDHICGNEEVFYPPLTQVAHAMPAYTLQDSFNGQGLGVVWDRADERSAFVGSFSN